MPRCHLWSDYSCIVYLWWYKYFVSSQYCQSSQMFWASPCLTFWILLSITDHSSFSVSVAAFDDVLECKIVQNSEKGYTIQRPVPVRSAFGWPRHDRLKSIGLLDQQMTLKLVDCRQRSSFAQGFDADPYNNILFSCFPCKESGIIPGSSVASVSLGGNWHRPCVSFS